MLAPFLFLLREVFFGDRVGGALAVPEDVNDPVAVAVFEELEAVDAAGEGSGVCGVVAGLVGAPDVDDVSELLDLVVDAALEEAAGGHGAAAARDVVVDGEEDGVGVGRVLGGAGGDEAGVGEEEGAHAVPIAGLATGAGDDVVDRGDNGVDGVDVCGFGRGPVGVGGYVA